MANSDSNQPAKKPRLGETATTSDSIGKDKPFVKGNSIDEIELQFDDKQSLYVSKGLLSCASPVFKKMFESEFKEKEAKCIPLSGKSYDAFLEMLLFLHPAIQKPLSSSGESAMDVYRLAHEYQILTVLQSARSVVLQHILSITFKGEYDSYFIDRIDGKQYVGYCTDYCTKRDIDEFLMKHFELLKFGETYEDMNIYLRAVERISTLPMKRVAAHPKYKALKDASKMQIMQYRLKRYEKDDHCNEKLNLDFGMILKSDSDSDSE